MVTSERMSALGLKMVFTHLLPLVHTSGWLVCLVMSVPVHHAQEVRVLPDACRSQLTARQLDAA